MKSALIISGGELTSYLPKKEYDLTIAVDKGYLYAQKLNIVPNIVIGDFDSLPESDIDPELSEIIRHPVRKDDTDTMLAIKYAIEKGCNLITIICGLGSRMDHTYANISSMHYAVSHGCVCEMISEKEYLRTVTPKDGTVSIQKNEGFSLSLFALTDLVKDVSIQGTAYDCTTDLISSFPLGHGNHFVEDTVLISIKEGVLLIIESYEQ